MAGANGNAFKFSQPLWLVAQPVKTNSCGASEASWQAPVHSRTTKLCLQRVLSGFGECHAMHDRHQLQNACQCMCSCAPPHHNIAHDQTTQGSGNPPGIGSTQHCAHSVKVAFGCDPYWRAAGAAGVAAAGIACLHVVGHGGRVAALQFGSPCVCWHSYMCVPNRDWEVVLVPL